jgi:hypothetical protein
MESTAIPRYIQRANDGARDVGWGDASGLGEVTGLAGAVVLGLGDGVIEGLLGSSGLIDLLARGIELHDCATPAIINNDIQSSS